MPTSGRTGYRDVVRAMKAHRRWLALGPHRSKKLAQRRAKNAVAKQARKVNR